MKYGKNIVSNLINQIIKIFLSFIVSILVARKLGTEQKGVVSYVLMIFGMIGGYCNLGINNASAYFQKKSIYSEKEVYCVNNTFTILNIMFFSILVILMKYNHIILIKYDYKYVIIGIIYASTSYIISSITQFYIGNERIYESNKYIRRTYFLEMFLLICIYFADILNSYSYLVIILICSITNVILLTKNVKIKFSFKLNKKLIISELKYGFPLYLGALFIFLNYRIDQIFIEKMVSISELGVYSIGVSLAELIFLIPESVATALIGKLYNESNNNNKVVIKTIKYVFYFCIIVVVIGYCFIDLIPIVYGKQYKGACSVTSILFIGVIFASVGKISAPYFYTNGLNLIHLVICFICLMVNVFLNIIFIPGLGIKGAAIASTIAYFVYGFLYIIVFKLKGFLLKDFLVLNKDDVNLIKEVIVYIKKWVIDDDKY